MYGSVGIERTGGGGYSYKMYINSACFGQFKTLDAWFKYNTIYLLVRDIPQQTLKSQMIGIFECPVNSLLNDFIISENFHHNLT